MRKLILYISMSLDGYIAKKGDDLSFLSLVQKEGEDYGYHKFMETIDTLILGRRTYDWVMQQVEDFPHTDKASYVITKQERASIGNIQFYNQNLKELVVKLKKQNSKKHIFCDGGAQIVNELLRDKLFDELIISIVPVLLGEGIPLFQDNRPENVLNLIKVKTFKSGLVQLHYELH